MSGLEQVGILGFLSIFHVIGGSVIGAGVRGLLRGQPTQMLFSLVFGGMFGCMPFVFGLTFLATGAPYLIVIEALVFVAAICVAAFTPDWVRQMFSDSRVGSIAFGGLFMLVGLGVGLFAIRDEPLAGLLVMLIFGGAGFLVLLSGLRSLLKER